MFVSLPSSTFHTHSSHEQKQFRIFRAWRHVIDTQRTNTRQSVLAPLSGPPSGLVIQGKSSALSQNCGGPTMERTEAIANLRNDSERSRRFHC